MNWRNFSVNNIALNRIYFSKFPAGKCKQKIITFLNVINNFGRVNLIGEHVDYCGYPVLPMAIEQCILLAVIPSVDNKLQLRNVNAKYEPYETDINDFK